MTDEQATHSADIPNRQSGLWAQAFRRLGRNKAATASALFLGIITVLSVLVPMLSPHGLDEVFWDYIDAPPSLSSGFLFGTDSNGRDLLVRVFYGGRISLAIGLIATLVSAVIGVSYGVIAGYAGGRLDNLMMRFVELLYAMPFMFLVILLMVLFGRNIFLIFIAIGAIEWLDVARIARGQAIAIKSSEYIEAAVVMGASQRRIVFRHLVPNSIGPVLVYMTLLVPKVILLESFLSFLGLGVEEPLTSWGVLISEGTKSMETSPWMLIIPGLFLSATLVAFNFLGDGLRDALDPRDSRR